MKTKRKMTTKQHMKALDLYLKGQDIGQLADTYGVTYSWMWQLVRGRVCRLNTKDVNTPEVDPRQMSFFSEEPAGSEEALTGVPGLIHEKSRTIAFA